MEGERIGVLVDENDRFKVIAYKIDGMIWCGLCGDRPPIGPCLLCDVQMCGWCESMHFHPEERE